jgi:hypothetical protein
VKTLVVPRTNAPLNGNGDLDEDAWLLQSARTGAFRDDDGEVRPYSDARFLCDDEFLYVGLYAADEDIHANVHTHDGPAWTDDAFLTRWSPERLPGTTLLLDVNAAGALTDAREVGGKRDVTWESGAKAAVDRDGTVNDSHDLDEEWVVEMAIPLSALGGDAQTIHAVLSRCDTPKGGKKRCGRWEGDLTLSGR